MEVFMPSETQKQVLRDGSVLEISRNGRHQYQVSGGALLPNVTAILGHISGDTFGIGVNWAAKLIRESGDFDAAKKAGKEAAEIGTNLHKAVEQYIRHGSVEELDPIFPTWKEHIGERYWLGCEQFVIDEKMGYGGTVDAYSMEQVSANGQGAMLWDWKTKDADSFSKRGSDLKDHAQVAAYVHAYNQMGGRHSPIIMAQIGYVMRDGSGMYIVHADLELGWNLFQAAHHIYTLVKWGSKTSHVDTLG